MDELILIFGGFGNCLDWIGLGGMGIVWIVG